MGHSGYFIYIFFFYFLWFLYVPFKSFGTSLSGVYIYNVTSDQRAEPQMLDLMRHTNKKNCI